MWASAPTGAGTEHFVKRGGFPVLRGFPKGAGPFWPFELGESGGAELSGGQRVFISYLPGYAGKIGYNNRDSESSPSGVSLLPFCTGRKEGFP